LPKKRQRKGRKRLTLKIKNLAEKPPSPVELLDEEAAMGANVSHTRPRGASAQGKTKRGKRRAVDEESGAAAAGQKRPRRASTTRPEGMASKADGSDVGKKAERYRGIGKRVAAPRWSGGFLPKTEVECKDREEW